VASAKDIIVRPISQKQAARVVKSCHYSGKVVQNSQLHLGVFLDGRLEGVMQFGPSLDKKKTMSLVRDTKWNGFIELNRMAFSDRLPRNSESRAIAVAMKIIKKNYPHIEWVISFADGTQCGDGTIYRASGFVLTGIKKNTTIWAAPSGELFTDIGLRTGKDKAAEAQKIINRHTATTGASLVNNSGAASMSAYKAAGFRPLPGYQLRYVYFLNPEARARLSVPELPFSKIDEIGARMYKGAKGGISTASGASGDQPEGDGAIPIIPLHSRKNRKTE